jgi:FixJ family two-component response regulator
LYEWSKSSKTPPKKPRKRKLTRIVLFSTRIYQRPIDFFFCCEYLERSGEFKVIENLISIVDDDESVRRTTTLLIESFGFRAAAFESAEAFLSSGRLHDTSCLVVDVQMPGMNGLELQGYLAAAGYGIPIIFMTAYDSKDSRERALQAGAAGFLGKPFSDQQLLQTIRSALHLSCRDDC